MLFALDVALQRLFMKVLKFSTRFLSMRQPECLTGPGSSLDLMQSIADSGVQRVLIVSDKVLLDMGLLDDMRAALSARGLSVHIFDGVTPDPVIEQIEAGLALLRQHDCQAVLAVGGGSPIDAAKMIAACATNSRPIEKMAGLLRVRKPMLPMYAVPTTAGTGSETTFGAVITKADSGVKLVIADPKLVPDMAALDGRLAVGLPPAMTAATGMDALTHAVEAYLSQIADQESDRLARKAVTSIYQHLPWAYGRGAQDVHARQQLAEAAFKAGQAISISGVGYIHAIAHNVGARYHVPHGLANAIIMPWVLDFCREACLPRLADLARAAGLGHAGDSEAALAAAFIDSIRNLNQQFGIPSQLDKLRAQDIPIIVQGAMAEARFTYSVPRYMRATDCAEVLKRMLPTTTAA